MTAKQWFHVSWRLLLSLGLLLCMGLIAVRALAYWYSLGSAPEGLEKAMRLDPGNPQYPASLARFYLGSFERYDPGEAVRQFETATRLAPARAAYWAELGGAYELAGRPDDARRAYEQARRLFPNSPDINWQAANFYLRTGRIEDTLPALHKVLLGDPQLRQPAFDLVWRAGVEPGLILDRMIPEEAEILLGYLSYLVEKQRLDAAPPVWQRLSQRAGGRLGRDVKNGLAPHRASGGRQYPQARGNQEMLLGVVVAHHLDLASYCQCSPRVPGGFPRREAGMDYKVLVQLKDGGGRDVEDKPAQGFLAAAGRPSEQTQAGQ